jgi:L-threonylcarbamoyladenylate synthase
MFINHNAILQATELLKAGKLVAIPTETVYGLGADALNSVAIQKIYTAKGRPSTNPLIIHLANAETMVDWAIDIPDDAWKLAEAFWPGPLTLILPKHPRVPLCATGNQQSIGLRVPNHPITLALLKTFGSGVAAPSANRYGRISPTTPNHVLEELGDKVDFILEGGPCTVGIESTIVSMIGKPRILRQGGIGLETLRNHIAIDDEPLPASNIQVPGQHHSHYAPVKPLYLIETKQLITSFSPKGSCNAMGFSEVPSTLKPYLNTWIRASSDPLVYAHELYTNLRKLDKNLGDYIVIETPPNHPAWLAIKDRLQRASTHLY